MNREFSRLMDEVCTSLLEGSMWHSRSATEAQKIAVRGVARWHNCESTGDHCSRLKLEKLLRDKLDYAPTLDTSVTEKAATYTIDDVAALKSHLETWIAREEGFVSVLNNSVKMAATEDIQIYKELICLTGEVQDEKTRVNLLIKRLSLSDFSGHDVGVVSRILHEHFEDGGKSSDLNVNLG